MKHTAARCPDFETIAAYLDGRLSDRERTRVTAHLAECEECYALFRESAQTHLEDVDRVVSMRTRRERLPRPRVVLTSAAAVMATAAAVWLVVGSLMRTDADRQLQTLVAATGTERLIEARLSGGFQYGELRGTRRGDAATQPVASAEVRLAAGKVEKALASASTPDALHAVGVASMLIGDFDRAIRLLDQSAQTSPHPNNLSDLAAAYLARASKDGRRQDAERALDSADRALKIDQASAEAMFNRALALERLSLADEARAAWQEYLRVDRNSGWARDAHSHLDAR